MVETKFDTFIGTSNSDEGAELLQSFCKWFTCSVSNYNIFDLSKRQSQKVLALNRLRLRNELYTIIIFMKLRDDFFLSIFFVT